MTAIEALAGRQEGTVKKKKGCNTVGVGHHHRPYYCAAYMYAIAPPTAVVYLPGDFI